MTLARPQVDQVAKDLVWGNGAPTSPADAHVLRFVERRSRGIALFLDIGAYSCLFSLVAAKSNPSANVLAFEVLPENYLLCWQNIIENDLVRQIDIRLCGIGNQAGAIVMPVRTGASSNPSSISLSANFETGVSVPVIELDSLSPAGRMLWKIDVEGFEWSVIDGARNTIAENRPDIICEILPSFPDASELQSLLEPLGYTYFIALDRGFEQRSDIVPSRDGRDWLFTTKSAD